MDLNDWFDLHMFLMDSLTALLYHVQGDFTLSGSVCFKYARVLLYYLFRRNLFVLSPALEDWNVSVQRHLRRIDQWIIIVQVILNCIELVPALRLAFSFLRDFNLIIHSFHTNTGEKEVSIRRILKLKNGMRLFSKGSIF